MADSTTVGIYLKPSGPVIQELTEKYKPTGAQSLIRVEYSGINPADTKHAAIGLHSSIAGYDMSGEVLAIGPDSPFQVGDKIFGMNPAQPVKPLDRGAHQDFAIADDPHYFTRVPTDRMTVHDAATVPVMTSTSGDGLFNILGLAFPDAGIEGTEAQPLLVWGAASSVGAATVQLAKAAGHGPIYATASAKHHAALRALGATLCFDYHDQDVVEQIREAVRASGKPLRRVFDTVGLGGITKGPDFEKSTPALAARCLSEGGEVKLACVLPAFGDPRYGMCFATRRSDREFPPAYTPDLPTWQAMQNKVIAWVVQNYGRGTYLFPNIRTVKGVKECLEAMKWSADGKSSLEKIVVEHPL